MESAAACTAAASLRRRALAKHLLNPFDAAGMSSHHEHITYCAGQFNP